MAIVLCKHNLNTTKFLAKGKVVIHLTKGKPILIDEHIVARYPSSFEIIGVVEAPDADSEEIEVEPETATDESEIVEPEGKTPIEVFEDTEEPFAVNLTDEMAGEIYEEPEKVNEDDVKAELLKAIDGFKNKKKFDEYAAGLGVELDRRKTMKDMKADLKEAWSL